VGEQALWFAVAAVNGKDVTERHTAAQSSLLPSKYAESTVSILSSRNGAVCAG
jgi:hypothetical protein